MYTVKQVAKMLGKHPDTISSYISRGLLKAKKLDGKTTNGNRYIITDENINEFLGK